MKPKKLKNKRKTNLSFAKFFNPEKSPHTSFNPITGIIEYLAKHETKRLGKVVFASWIKGKDGKKIPYQIKIHGLLKVPKNK